MKIEEYLSQRLRKLEDAYDSLEDLDIRTGLALYIALAIFPIHILIGYALIALALVLWPVAMVIRFVKKLTRG